MMVKFFKILAGFLIGLFPFYILTNFRWHMYFQWWKKLNRINQLRNQIMLINTHRGHVLLTHSSKTLKIPVQKSFDDLNIQVVVLPDVDSN